MAQFHTYPWGRWSILCLLWLLKPADYRSQNGGGKALQTRWRQLGCLCPHHRAFPLHPQWSQKWGQGHVPWRQYWRLHRRWGHISRQRSTWKEITMKRIWETLLHTSMILKTLGEFETNQSTGKILSTNNLFFDCDQIFHEIYCAFLTVVAHQYCCKPVVLKYLLA